LTRRHFCLVHIEIVDHSRISEDSKHSFKMNLVARTKALYFNYILLLLVSVSWRNSLLFLHKVHLNVTGLIKHGITSYENVSTFNWSEWNHIWISSSFNHRLVCIVNQSELFNQKHSICLIVALRCYWQNKHTNCVMFIHCNFVAN
jgi:hypothetical protein